MALPPILIVADQPGKLLKTIHDIQGQLSATLSQPSGCSDILPSGGTLFKYSGKPVGITPHGSAAWREMTGTLRYLLVVAAICTPLPLKAASEAGQQPDAPSAVKASAWQTAQDSNSRDPRQNIVARVSKRGLKDQAGIFRAPFTRDALPWDIGVSAVIAGLIASDRRASDALSQAHGNVSLHISDAGLYGTMGSVVAFYISGLATDNAHAKETGLLGAEAVANSMVLYDVLQYATGRERPLEGHGAGRFWQNNTPGSSFPSGHSIATWAAASMIAHEYPSRWVQIAAYGTAGAVSITRYSAMQHFPADVFVGGALGYFVGQHIFHSHCRTGLSGACDTKKKLRATMSP